MTDAAAADSTLLAAAGDDYDDWSSNDIEQNNGQLQWSAIDGPDDGHIESILYRTK